MQLNINLVTPLEQYKSNCWQLDWHLNQQAAAGGARPLAAAQAGAASASCRSRQGCQGETHKLKCVLAHESQAVPAVMG